MRLAIGADRRGRSNQRLSMSRQLPRPDSVPAWPVLCGPDLTQGRPRRVALDWVSYTVKQEYFDDHITTSTLDQTQLCHYNFWRVKSYALS
jgi:hypothetical protein